MHIEGFGDQQRADDDEERQRENLQRRMLVDEIGDGPGRNHHHQHRNHDCRDHHRHMLHQAYRGDHRIQREDDVDHCDLQDDANETRLGRAAGGLFFLAFDAVPDFQGALEQQEQAAKEQDQVTPRYALPRTVNRSLVRRITQAIDSNSRMRVPIASARPKKRALGCCSWAGG